MSSIKQNEPLANYCTYHIGGPAKVLFAARDIDEIIAGLEVARENNFKFFVLGGGSNILFPDEGYPGLVLKIENNFIESKEADKNMLIKVGAGTPLPILVSYALKNSLTGMEWAAGIPGTVGGAIRGNAGAFHADISEVVRRVAALEILPPTITKKVFEKSECDFSYRESIFKHNKKLVIISAVLALKIGRAEKIEALMNEYLAKKTTSQPLDYPSAGSVFTNPQGFFAGKLIESCGFKGQMIGDAQVSEKHANFIINRGNATAQNVKVLIARIKTAVKEKFNIDLREEIEIVEN